MKTQEIIVLKKWIRGALAFSLHSKKIYEGSIKHFEAEGYMLATDEEIKANAEALGLKEQKPAPKTVKKESAK